MSPKPTAVDGKQPASPTTGAAGDLPRRLEAHEAWQLLALLRELAPRQRQELLRAGNGPVGAVRALIAGAHPSYRPPWPLPAWRARAAAVGAAIVAGGGRLLTPDCRDYPESLLALADAPPVLYVRGQLRSVPGVAIVGSRECSAYGRRVAYQLAHDLGRAGLLVISGLARGIDAAAHRGALDSGGPTAAVLPCGIDRVYPAQHLALARRITRQGGLLSEYPPATPVAPWNFPVRNRLIAGLALVTVVVEAAARSGAKITADLALDAGREVLAVPGLITSPTSAGAHKLLAQGAHVCTGWRDVVEQLHADLKEAAEARHAAAAATVAAAAQDLGEAERLCLAALPAAGACSIEVLAAKTPLAIPALLAALTNLEVRGLVRSRGGQRYERAVSAV